jgi:hypothetical protein
VISAVADASGVIRSPGSVALGEPGVQGAAGGVGVLVADPRLHRGVDRSRPVGVDGHAGARELGGEVDSVGLDGGLRGDVGVGTDHGHGRGDDAAADVDHAAPAALEDPRQQRDGQLGHARDVEGEGAGEFLDVDVGAGAEGRNDRRVVDEDVDAAELVMRAPRERRRGARGGEVGDDWVRAAARGDDGARRRTSSASERAATATWAPCCASCTAMARPMPRPPPVIRAALSSRWVMEWSCVVEGMVLTPPPARPGPWCGRPGRVVRRSGSAGDDALAAEHAAAEHGDLRHIAGAAA